MGKDKTKWGGVGVWASWGAAGLRPHMILRGDYFVDVGMSGRIRADG